MPKPLQLTPFERFLLRQEGRLDADVLAASFEMLDDRDNLSTIALAWSQFGWICVIALTGRAWPLVPMALDIALYAMRWRHRRGKPFFGSAVGHRTNAGLAWIFILQSVLVGSEMVVLTQASYETAVILGMVLGMGFMGYVSALQSVFLRLALLNIAILMGALSVGLIMGPSDEARPFAVLVPFGILAYAALSQRTHLSILGAIRNQMASQRLSLHDPLTKLPNRAFMRGRLDGVLSRIGTQDGARSVAALCLDLDGFKAINDQHGHAGGDWALIHIASVLGDMVEGDDVCCRIGGDEFTLILCDVDADAVYRTGDRIIAEISKPFDIGDGSRVEVGATIGAAITADRFEDPVSFLMRADAMLYEAKRAGKGRVRVHGAPHPDAADASYGRPLSLVG